MRAHTHEIHKVLWLAVCLTIWLGATPAGASFDCPEGMVPLESEIAVSGNVAVCYQFAVPEESALVRFQVETGSPLDLYFTEGLQASLSAWDRVNVGPVDGDTKFVLLGPAPGEYTVAVAPEVDASYTLLATAAVSDDDEFEICFEETGECTTAVPMILAPEAGGSQSGGIELGSEFGDRVIFPMTVEAPGKVTATVSWTGDASRLSLILNGPERPELSNPVAYYARSDGASPLTLEYDVTGQDLEKGKRFQLSVVNFSGGEAFGDIELRTTKEGVKFNFRRLSALELAAKPAAVANPSLAEPVQPQPGGTIELKPGVVRPNPGVIQFQQLAIDPQKVCFDAVQGKIAWDYNGSKSWNPSNVERLCEGTTEGREPAACFQQVMHGGVDWGGGTQWSWRNAINLCEGTNDARATITCFQRTLARGGGWSRAIDRCETR